MTASCVCEWHAGRSQKCVQAARKFKFSSAWTKERFDRGAQFERDRGKKRHIFKPKLVSAIGVWENEISYFGRRACREEKLVSLNMPTFGRFWLDIWWGIISYSLFTSFGWLFFFLDHIIKSIWMIVLLCQDQRMTSPWKWQAKQRDDARMCPRDRHKLHECMCDLFLMIVAITSGSVAFVIVFRVNTLACIHVRIFNSTF